jgi:hypothetical protein
MKLCEITIPKIRDENQRGFPDTKKRQHLAHLVNAANLTLIPYKPSSVLKATAKSVSNGHQYDTEMEFSNVDYSDTGRVLFRGSDNENYRINPISIRSEDVKISCECMDFQFRFANLHNNNDSLLGDPPPPYIKTTDRPPVNPLQVLGACKHILALADKLRNHRILVQ